MTFGFFGLDAAGKTSFLAFIQEKIHGSWDPKPTKGINRSETNALGQGIAIWDFGGQENYRNRYLTSEKDLSGLEFIFHLVDIQAAHRFEESAGYLTQILNKLINFPKSNLIICLHKLDPKIKNLEKTQNNLMRAFDIFDNVAPEAYGIYNTSIFEEFSIHRAFSQALKVLADPVNQIRKTLNDMLKNATQSSIVLIDDTPLVLGSVASNELPGGARQSMMIVSSSHKGKNPLGNQKYPPREIPPKSINKTITSSG